MSARWARLFVGWSMLLTGLVVAVHGFFDWDVWGDYGLGPLVLMGIGIAVLELDDIIEMAGRSGGGR